MNSDAASFLGKNLLFELKVGNLLTNVFLSGEMWK
ncbi:hypothetical protein HME9304_02296 [Flagellimonas maritima]|uniref:Uncharacterized protein n=1 Tax=Flagellimonas maritima TaxID=1383885 RepID=A0A2Z4LUM5_9FLAO|nr:hypothetical protein HME9304_02296 [Allomuricauda aurantiaca]